MKDNPFELTHREIDRWFDKKRDGIKMIVDKAYAKKKLKEIFGAAEKDMKKKGYTHVDCSFLD